MELHFSPGVKGCEEEGSAPAGCGFRPASAEVNLCPGNLLSSGASWMPRQGGSGHTQGREAAAAFSCYSNNIFIPLFLNQAAKAREGSSSVSAAQSWPACFSFPIASNAASVPRERGFHCFEHPNLSSLTEGGQKAGAGESGGPGRGQGQRRDRQGRDTVPAAFGAGLRPAPVTLDPEPQDRLHGGEGGSRKRRESNAF